MPIKREMIRASFSSQFDKGMGMYPTLPDQKERKLPVKKLCCDVHNVPDDPAGHFFEEVVCTKK